MSFALTETACAIDTASTESRDDANTLRELSALEAMLACSQDAATRLVGLYWKPTFQALVTQADSSLRRVRQLRDRAIALPPRSAGCSRAVSLRGATTALEAHGMHHRYVRWIDLPDDSQRTYDSELRALSAGLADAVYVQGIDGQAAVRQHGLRVLTDIGAHRDRWVKLNGAVLVALTVEKIDLQHRFEDVVRRLAQVRCAVSSPGVTLTAPSLAALESGKQFLLRWGFIDGFEIESWIDRRPLAQALHVQLVPEL